MLSVGCLKFSTTWSDNLADTQPKGVVTLNGLSLHFRRDRRSLLVRAFLTVAVATALTGCRLVSSPAEAQPVTQRDVAAAAGWTRIASTASYFVVANVLPGEHMYTLAEDVADHPTVGELIISGVGNPVGDNVRHVEAHIYDRSTGMPLRDVRPSIEVLNRRTGQRIDVAPTLMQDLAIGALDVHYGNNVAVQGDSDLTITITIGDEVVTLDGHLD